MIKMYRYSFLIDRTIGIYYNDKLIGIQPHVYMDKFINSESGRISYSEVTCDSVTLDWELLEEIIRDNKSVKFAIYNDKENTDIILVVNAVYLRTLSIIKDITSGRNEATFYIISDEWEKEKIIK